MAYVRLEEVIEVVSTLQADVFKEARDVGSITEEMKRQIGVLEIVKYEVGKLAQWEGRCRRAKPVENTDEA